MGKLLLFYLLASATGHPFLILVGMVAVFYLLDRRTVRWTPSVIPAFRRLIEQRRLEREVRINPHDADARAGLGALLLESGRPLPAVQQLETAIQKLGDVAETHYLLGLALLKSSRWREARERFEKSLQIDPGFRMGEALLRLGEYWARAGDHERAQAAFDAFLERNDSSVEGHVLSARDLHAAGDLPAARKHIEKALLTYREAPRFRRKLDRLWAWRARTMRRGLRP